MYFLLIKKRLESALMMDGKIIEGNPMGVMSERHQMSICDTFHFLFQTRNQQPLYAYPVAYIRMYMFV